jgi:hypothetical protein
VALLVARCLTSEREAPRAPAAMLELARSEPVLGDVAQLVVRALTAHSVTGRPPLTELSSALAAAVVRMSDARTNVATTAPTRIPDNVVAWRPVGRHRGVTGPNPLPQPGPTLQPAEPQPAWSGSTGPVPGPPTGVPPIQGTPRSRTGLYVTLVVAALLILLVIILKM